jgi:hypothetical protein
MSGPYIYSNPRSLLNPNHVADVAGNNMGECVSLVKRYVPELQNRSSRTWIAGRNIIETLQNGGTIIEGTAIATFRHGSFESGHGHAAFFAGWFNDVKEGIRIIVVEQYNGLHPSLGVQERPLRSRGKNADGSYVDPSNNGEAFSEIL